MEIDIAMLQDYSWAWETCLDIGWSKKHEVTVLDRQHDAMTFDN